MSERIAEPTYRGIDLAPFQSVARLLPCRGLGAAPQLQWIDIDQLVIDPAYQRTIERRGALNIVKIAREFDWSKFATVVVAPIEGGRYAIVDGQHRTTAAAIRGVKQVPCQIIVADRGRQAAAFAAINGNVTAMSPMQVHAARVAAGEPGAVLLRDVCARAGVTICRYPVKAGNMKVGETLAAAQLAKMLDRFGEDVLETALTCITRTRNGYPGLVRANLVEALCVVFEAEPNWAESPKLLKAVSKIDLQAVFTDACRDAKMSRSRVTAVLVDTLCTLLEEHLSPETVSRETGGPAA